MRELPEARNEGRFLNATEKHLHSLCQVPEGIKSLGPILIIVLAPGFCFCFLLGKAVPNHVNSGWKSVWGQARGYNLRNRDSPTCTLIRLAPGAKKGSFPYRPLGTEWFISRPPLYWECRPLESRLWEFLLLGFSLEWASGFIYLLSCQSWEITKAHAHMHAVLQMSLVQIWLPGSAYLSGPLV